MLTKPLNHLSSVAANPKHLKRLVREEALRHVRKIKIAKLVAVVRAKETKVKVVMS